MAHTPRQHSSWRLLALSVALAATAFTVGSVSAVHAPSFERRTAHSDATSVAHGISGNGHKFDGKTFDYVVVGGGTAGLVVASRLSENPSVSVAVIEAGISGEGDPSLTTPSAMLYNSSEHTIKDWADNTVNQSGLGGRPIYYPRGKVLGGSSAINGMYLVRQPAAEQKGWSNLVSDISCEAQDTWSWENMFNALKKSENFNKPAKGIEKTLKEGAPGRKHRLLWYDEESHGTGGPIHYSWPGDTFPVVGAFLQGGQDAMNIVVNHDPDSGDNSGPFLSTSAINPTNWTRSFSRTGYLDPYLYRTNLHVLVSHQATKILFDRSSDTPRATGVQFAKSNHSKVFTVKAKKEVIVSAGTVGSAQLLQLSGIGDESVLKAANVKQIADVPGVGFHMQDHLSSSLSYTSIDGIAVPAKNFTHDAAKDSFVNSAVAYVPISKLMDTESLVQKIKAHENSFVDAYDAPDTVKEGYRATLKELTETFYPADVPAVEILLFMMGGQVMIQCGLQHPTSQGSIKIKSGNAFEAPDIDPGFARNKIDLQVLTHGCEMAREIGASKAMSKFVKGETDATANVKTAKQWRSYLRQSGGTEYHPSSSNAMMALEHGGVVDDRLRVYHTDGLRVIDASIAPISFSQHLLTLTYAIGEIGAELIKEDAENACAD